LNEHTIESNRVASRRAPAKPSARAPTERLRGRDTTDARDRTHAHTRARANVVVDAGDTVAHIARARPPRAPHPRVPGTSNTVYQKHPSLIKNGLSHIRTSGSSRGLDAPTLALASAFS